MRWRYGDGPPRSLPPEALAHVVPPKTLPAVLWQFDGSPFFHPPHLQQSPYPLSPLTRNPDEHQGVAGTGSANGRTPARRKLGGLLLPRGLRPFSPYVSVSGNCSWSFSRCFAPGDSLHWLRNASARSRLRRERRNLRVFVFVRATTEANHG